MESTGLKTKFYRESQTPGTYELIAKIANIQPPQLEREVAEVEDLDPPDEVRKKLPGLINAGEVTLTLNFDDTEEGHTALEDDFYAASIKNYRIKLPNGKGWTFPGFVSGWAPQQIAQGDVIQAEVTIAVTGKPTFGAIEP